MRRTVLILVAAVAMTWAFVVRAAQENKVSFDVDMNLGRKLPPYEEMLKKSDDVNYLLKIKDRLYNVIEEIESYKTQLRVYDNKVAYSTVTMTLDEVVEYTPITTPKDSFGTRVSSAFRESWKNFADGCEALFVGLVYSLPTLIVIAVLGTGAAFVLILCVKKAKRKAPKQPDSDD